MPTKLLKTLNMKRCQNQQPKNRKQLRHFMNDTHGCVQALIFRHIEAKCQYWHMVIGENHASFE